MTEARKDRRAPASIKVKYKSANMIEFVELIGGDVSRGGIFVKTKKPLDPGALLKFEFQLQTGEPMIYGVGRVAWRRTEEGSRPNLPAGMGIKFIKLNGLSRSVIDRIEAKHGPGSRFDQTDGAEIASSISSAPPSGLSQAPELATSLPPSATLITPLRPEAMRAAAEADALAAPRLTQPSLDESGRPTRSSPALTSPALKEAKASGPKPSILPVTFRPPPPAAVGSVPPPHSSSSNPPRAPSVRPGSSGAFGPAAKATGTSGTYGAAKSSGAYSQSGSPAEALGGGHAPRGALSSGAPGRRPISTRSAARDASEFLASAFSVGGAGREVRSEAHAQAERARHDPRSVDLANELFGDLNASGAKPEAALDADPMLDHLAPTTPPPDPGATARLSPGPLPARLSPQPAPAGRLSPGPQPALPSASGSLRGRTSGPVVANNQLSLKLGNVANETTLRPAAGGGRVVWIAGIAILGLAVGAAAFYLQQGAGSVVGQGAEQPPTAAVPPAQPVAPTAEAAPVATIVALALSSEPAGAQVKVDGAPAGNTPTTLELTQGKTVQISLYSPGFATKAESVNVVADMPARSVTLEPLPYELVVTEPAGATVKVLDKSVEAPAPLNLGVLFPVGASTGPQEVTLTVEKTGFQRATRKLTRADFQEQATAMRAELSMPLVATGPAAKAASASASAKAPAAKAPAAAKIAAAPSTSPPEPSAPPEPEGAATETPKAEAAPAAPAPAPAAPEKPKVEAAPAPAEAPAPPAPKPSDIPTDL